MITDGNHIQANRNTPHILLVNPWIHDFAAYDFWAKPIGLLYFTALLRSQGFIVSYIDCTDRFHPEAPSTNPYARYGRGPYLKVRLKKPKGLEDVPRYFSRYGIKPGWFEKDLLAVSKPNLILVTSLMTYWYPGVRETIGMLKSFYPDVPVFLGGIYATLCYDHAVKHSGADKVITGTDMEQILNLFAETTGYPLTFNFNIRDLDGLPYPAYDLQSEVAYIPIRTSVGCPYACDYCASHILDPTRQLRTPGSVVEEIRYWHRQYDVKDFAIYDDAFLVDAQHHAIPILEDIIRSGLKVRFHTPNAIHVRGISAETADLMFKCGFKTLRLGLETARFDNRDRLDRKVNGQEFNDAVAYLKGAGFKRQDIGAYLLAGLPDQSIHDIEESIRIVKQHNISPILAYYSPIPGTALWEKAVSVSRYALESDPIFTNNAIFPCQSESFSWEHVSQLKALIKS